jgi:hypothetical protein
VIFTFLTLVISSAILTVLHDPYSRTFATALAGSFVVLGLLSPAFLGSLVLRILGTVSCLYSIFDIYWDILARGSAEAPAENDAVAFSQLTGFPASSVGFLWLVASALYFALVLRIIVRQAPIEARTAPARA